MFRIAGIIVHNKLWLLIFLTLVRAYGLVKSEVLRLQLNFCDGSPGPVSVCSHVYGSEQRGTVGKELRSGGLLFPSFRETREYGKNHFIFYAALINCPFVLFLLCFLSNSQTNLSLGRWKE